MEFSRSMYFIYNFYKYHEIINLHTIDFDESIRTILNNNELYREAVNVQKQLTLVASVLDKVTNYILSITLIIFIISV